jgi:hypothetical protein
VTEIFSAMAVIKSKHHHRLQRQSDSGVAASTIQPRMSQQAVTNMPLLHSMDTMGKEDMGKIEDLI